MTRTGRKPLRDEPMVQARWTIEPRHLAHVRQMAEERGFRYESEYIRDLLDRDMKEQVREEGDA